MISERNNDENGKKAAKGLFVKQRYFSPVLVRGQEDTGIRAWGYGITAYKKLLSLVLNPEYGDITDLDFAESSFDKVYSLHTIEHLPDLEQFFAEVARVLKPGGTAIIIYPWELFQGMQAIGAAIRQYRNPLLARKIHLHRLTPKSIGRLIAGISLTHRESRLVFAMGIQYMTILTKRT